VLARIGLLCWGAPVITEVRVWALGALLIVGTGVAGGRQALSQSGSGKQQQRSQTETLCTSFPNYSCVEVYVGPTRPAAVGQAGTSGATSPQKNPTSEQSNNEIVCTPFPQYSCTEIYLGEEGRSQTPELPITESVGSGPGSQKRPQTMTECMVFPQYSCTEVYVGPNPTSPIRKETR